MADEIKNFAETARILGERLGESREQIAKMVEEGKKLDAAGTSMKNLANETKKAKEEADKFHATLTPIKDAIEDARKSSSSLISAIAAVGAALYNTTNAAMDAGDSFAAAFNQTSFGKVIGGIDEVTKMSREFRGEAIKVGSEFGLGFDEITKTYQSYAGAILMAQGATYGSRKEIELQAAALAKMGISMEELTRTLYVGGQQQNLLSEGFRLAQDSGLNEARVFEMMATASRKMGLSIEDAGRPILALESLAKSTGLPISELSNKVFGLASQYSRFGMSVESLSPILRRFTDILGDGFKGLAIDDTLKLVQGLAGQVNTTNAAFMAMQSGMARPGAGVAGAMLDFEDAMAEPEKAMKMLASSLGSISGGKILTMQDAHASEQAATQFKIQRDMLTQLTGINDPQQTRTLMALLSAQQSGKTLTSEENKTLADAMKSGANKQEEQRSLAEKIGKAQVGLLAQIALDMSNMATRNFGAQAQSAIIGGATNKLSEYSAAGRNFLAEKINEKMAAGLELADKFLAEKTPESVKKAGRAVGQFIEEGKENITENPVQRISAFNKGEQALIFGGKENLIPGQVAPTPVFPTNQPAPGAPTPTVSSRAVQEPGGKETTNVVVTFRATDELGRAMANAASVTVNKTLHGNG